MRHVTALSADDWTDDSLVKIQIQCDHYSAVLHLPSQRHVMDTEEMVNTVAIIN